MTELGTELKMESNDSSVSIEGGRTLNTKKIKESILPNLPYLFVFWLMDKIGEAYRLSGAVNFFSESSMQSMGLQNWERIRSQACIHLICWLALLACL